MLNQKYRVKDLNLYNYRIDVSDPINSVIEEFKANPQLPGVLVFQEDLFLGAVSQTSLWQYLSQPYSLGLCAKRPVGYLLEKIEFTHLIVSQDTLIIEAVQRYLTRTAKLLEQPLIVRITSLEYQLLDSHQLLIAYTKIYQLTNRLLENYQRELEESNYQLKESLGFDLITGLGNEFLLEESLEREWERAIREKKWLSVIRWDLDLFPACENIYSQSARDECLRRVAANVMLLLKGEIAIHTGEGRFTIIIPNSNTINATLKAEKISEVIQKLQITNSQTQIKNNLSLNLGIASIKPQDYEGAEQLLMAAEEALEKAKKIGKNCKIIRNISSSLLEIEANFATQN